MSAPRATMRLQLHQDFTFADAAALVPYMAELGISHLYASPILTARAGSMHGYDVTDPTQVNPELGGEEGLRALVAALRGAGLGLIVDIVPNHMAAGGMENPWWADVLRHGRASRFAGFFDIDWDADGKLLAPFLGEPYGDALANGTLRLACEAGGPAVAYYDNRFRIRPDDCAMIAALQPSAFDPATPEGRGRLHRLLERQHYRLAWWRTAGDTINWRRFFDINGLAALRVEDAAVFEATHATLFRLYQQGLIDGMRVDHVDGLADPPGYCRRLRCRLDALAAQRPADAPSGPAWLVVEKILGPGERLPDDWDVDGTSGYDFMEQVGALLHDPAGAAPLRRLWAEVSFRPADFAAEETVARRDVLERSFGAQRDALVAALHRHALRRVETRDTTAASIRRALTALLAHFPVYRSYGAGRPSAVLSEAAAQAMPDLRAADRGTLALLERWLGAESTPELAVRFQQLSAPLAAKAVEDTAFYRHGALLSRNEVGADLRNFGLAPALFHDACQERLRHFPNAMLATATHDHKRGEAVRSRLAVLSERPDEWQAALHRWLAMNASHRGTGPSPGDEAMLYQMIIGAWPLDAAELPAFAERLAEWQLKALREAKLATDWESPNQDYEEACRTFLYTIMADPAFTAEASAYADRIAPAGAANSLAQTLLKLTVPGVPDFYHGTELWDQSLVDPDNRRPVDFDHRIEVLDPERSPVALAAHWRDGRVKQALIRRVLALRQEQPALFARGAYRPLAVSGPRAEHVVAFVRSMDAAQCVVVVPRLVAGFVGNRLELRPEAWEGTAVHLPHDLAGRTLHDCIGERDVAVAARAPVAEVLGAFPVALLEAPG